MARTSKTASTHYAVGSGGGPTTDGSNIIAAGAAGAYGTDGPDTAVGA